jgi:hypothetical protein
MTAKKLNPKCFHCGRFHKRRDSDFCDKHCYAGHWRNSHPGYFAERTRVYRKRHAAHCRRVARLWRKNNLAFARAREREYYRKKFAANRPLKKRRPRLPIPA